MPTAPRTGATRESVRKTFTQPGRTQQHFSKEANINSIVEKWLRTGTNDNINHADAIYGDFSNVGEYLNCIEKGQNAQDNFDALNSKIRDRFQNNPAALLDFMSDPSNEEEAVSLGLAEAPAPVRGMTDGHTFHPNEDNTYEVEPGSREPRELSDSETAAQEKRHPKRDTER